MPYKDELRKALHKLIERFFQEEMNNRITSFNINGLIGSLNALLIEHEVKKEES